jgi:hypothetical protein
MAKTPTVNRLQLGALLKKFRVDAGLSQEQLGRQVFPRIGGRAAQSKLAAIEIGDRSLHASELEALQSVLGIRDPELITLMTGMLRASSQRGRWGGYRAAYAENFRKFVDLEEDADLIREVAVGLMPDLLMCENYVRAVLAGHKETAELFESTVTASSARAVVLDDNERRFHFILCESAVRKAPRGDRALVREQVAHVIALSQRPNVAVQVVPFIQPMDTAYPVLYPLTYLRIPADGFVDCFEYVHIGAPDDRRYLVDKQALQVYDRCFSDAAAAAIGGDDARRFLREISREYR